MHETTKKWLSVVQKKLLMLRMWPAAITLNYSATNIRNDVRQILIYVQRHIKNMTLRLFCQITLNRYCTTYICKYFILINLINEVIDCQIFVSVVGIN